LNAGWLTGLVDLNTERDNVQERIADYLTDLIGIGFSGFRVDAAKHIKPDDLVAIFSKLKRNLGGKLPDDFITWWEILLGGEAQMLMCNKDSGYNYGAYIADALLAAGFDQDDVNKIKIWNSGYPKEPDADCGSITKWRNVIQNDDADQQMPGSTSRDMGDQGCILVKTHDVATHRMFEVKLFTNPNGALDNDNNYPIRAVLSSFYWPPSGGLGIPDGLSDCSKCTTTCQGCQTTPYAKAFDANSCGYDPTNYTRVHRDKTIINAMRSWMKLPPITYEQLGLSNCNE
jgi:alpha-amylase